MSKQLKITLIINKLLLGLKELILILYSTLLWYSYCYIYLYVCLYIHECICICAHAHVHTHVTLCENVSTCLRVLLLNMGVLHWECCMMYGKQSAVKYGNKLDLIWFDALLSPWNFGPYHHMKCRYCIETDFRLSNKVNNICLIRSSGYCLTHWFNPHIPDWRPPTFVIEVTRYSGQCYLRMDK